MAKYRKKPVVIDAMQITEDTSMSDIFTFFGTFDQWKDVGLCTIDIITEEGTMRATLWDWIIKGVKGEFYPCKPGIFEMTYEKAE